MTRSEGYIPLTAACSESWRAPAFMPARTSMHSVTFSCTCCVYANIHLVTHVLSACLAGLASNLSQPRVDATGIAATSVALGLDKGLRRLSQLNIVLAVVLLVFVLAVGPTVFIAEGMVQSLGSYFDALPWLAAVATLVSLVSDGASHPHA